MCLFFWSSSLALSFRAILWMKTNIMSLTSLSLFRIMRSLFRYPLWSCNMQIFLTTKHKEVDLWIDVLKTVGIPEEKFDETNLESDFGRLSENRWLLNWKYLNRSVQVQIFYNLFRIIKIDIQIWITMIWNKKRISTSL